MKAMECPGCGGQLDVYVDTLNPMTAVAADMLERAVMSYFSHLRFVAINFEDSSLPRNVRSSNASAVV